MAAQAVTRANPYDDHFETLFRAHFGRARGLATRRFPTLDAEEIAQEAMLRVFVSLNRVDRRCNPWPYIATITLKVGRSLARGARPTVALDLEAAQGPNGHSADEEMLAAELDEPIRRALACLTPAARQVLMLQAYCDMSVPQLAALLGCTDNAVRQKLFRARRQFLRALEDA